jgi:hypothetical protein
MTSLDHVHIQGFGGTLQSRSSCLCAGKQRPFNYFMEDCYFDAILGPGAAVILPMPGDLYA